MSSLEFKKIKMNLTFLSLARSSVIRSSCSRITIGGFKTNRLPSATPDGKSLKHTKGQGHTNVTSSQDQGHGQDHTKVNVTQCQGHRRSKSSSMSHPPHSITTRFLHLTPIHPTTPPLTFSHFSESSIGI